MIHCENEKLDSGHNTENWILCDERAVHVTYYTVNWELKVVLSTVHQGPFLDFPLKPLPPQLFFTFSDTLIAATFVLSVSVAKKGISSLKIEMYAYPIKAEEW